MKVGLVTIVDPNPNYGNKLQNYAAEQIFRRLGCEVTTLAPCVQNRTLTVAAKYGLRTLMSPVRPFAPEIRALYRRMFAFLAFDRENLHISEDLCRGKAVDFDFYATGSDQVWNPGAFWEDREKYYLLTFAEPAQKICMSPSFGVRSLEEPWKTVCADALKEFPALAVREETGAELIRQLTGREAEVLIDPTLMLDADDWRKISKISKKRKKYPGKYILTYFLSEEKKEYIEYAENLARDRGIPCFHLLDPGDPDMAVGPGGFLDLIEHAEAFVTDSFHGAVFSTVFHRPFVVMERIIDGRAVMGERTETLLNKLGIGDRWAGRLRPEDLMACDFSHVEERLEAERAKMTAYLTRCLEGAAVK